MNKRVWIVTDMWEIEITHDEHILRNLNWSNHRVLVRYEVKR
jgi:hypothetical protein